jgi:competence protein ComEC
MSDAAVIMLAVAACTGARLAVALPRVLVLAVLVSAAITRRSVVVIAGAGLLASALAANAWVGLRPHEPASFAGVVVLAGDPDDVHAAVRVDVRIGRRRVEVWAHGWPAAQLRQRLSGEQVWLRGRLRPPPEIARRRLAVRHIAGRLDVDEVKSWRPGSAVTRLTNGLRRTLEQGVSSLRRDNRALLLGVVLGDDRDQDDEMRDAFRASGLSHLLVVSGENVAFVLALAGPVLRRLGLRARWIATLLVLCVFGLLTRFEPSVMRAGAMAAIACTATMLGRPASRFRLLALAVAAVVLVDPMVVHSLGFRLSVGATIGITLFAVPVARRLPGPAFVIDPLAVTIAAQLGVAPIAMPAFGGIPIASLPANVLAIPAAAPLTAWGLTGGVLAGLAGPPFDRWLHVPTRVLTLWLAGVARWAAGLPLGSVHAGHAIAFAVVAVIWWSVGSARCRRWRSVRTASTSPTEPS